MNYDCNGQKWLIWDSICLILYCSTNLVWRKQVPTVLVLLFKQIAIFNNSIWLTLETSCTYSWFSNNAYKSALCHFPLSSIIHIKVNPGFCGEINVYGCTYVKTNLCLIFIFNKTSIIHNEYYRISNSSRMCQLEKITR